MKIENEEEKIEEFTYNVNVKMGSHSYVLEHYNSSQEFYLKIQEVESDDALYIPKNQINKFIKALNKFKEINNL